jgi:hypothetical protein
MPEYTPQSVKDAVDRHSEATKDMRSRMDMDYELWKLTPYAGAPEMSGFRKVTSNEPRTFANKVASILTDAILTIRVHQSQREREQRDQANDKERYAVGVLNAIDERLLALVEPTLKASLAWGVAIRGWYAGVFMLVKRETDTGTETVPHCMPWDIRNTYWGMGRDGISWACYKVKKTRAQIQDEYPDVVMGDARLNGSISHDDNEMMDVYDYFDADSNFVCTEDIILKPPTPHGSPRIPIIIGPVASNPNIVTEDGQSGSKFYGESIFQADRAQYDELNYLLSALSEFIKRSLKQPVVITSRDGRKMLSENPYLAGSTLQLAEGDKVETLNLLTMAQETGVYLSLVTGEIQRGALPHTAFGELQFQLSGFAINSLRQGMTTIIKFPLAAMESAYFQGLNLLADQYATGSFDTMELSGVTKAPERDYFSSEIDPQTVSQGGNFEVKLVAILPQDDMSNAARAQQLRAPDPSGKPVVSDRFIQDEVLGIADSDLMNTEILEQQAFRASPVAQAFAMWTAANEQGDETLAEIWLKEAKNILMQKELELMQLQMMAMGMGMMGQPGGGGPGGPGGPAPGGGGPGGGGPGGPEQGGGGQQERGGPGMAPTVLPFMAQGGRPSPEQSNGGPQVPPGTPRPGARQ